MERFSGIINSIKSNLQPTDEIALSPEEKMLRELHEMGFQNITLTDLTIQQEPLPPMMTFEERLAQTQAEWETNPPKFERVADRDLTLAQMWEQQQEIAQKADAYFGLLLPAISLLHTGGFQPA